MRLSEWIVYEKFQKWGKEGGLTRLLCFSFIGLISLSLNFPLARFPGQDLLWNDLMVLGRVAWAKAALLSNPFSSVDFLQGLGSPVMLDVKVVPHFFDPGVVFSIFVGDALSLAFRSFFLVVYCLYCLDRLIAQEDLGLKDGTQIGFGFRVPLLLFYVFSPMFFGDVAHHFSAVFYAIPGLILAIRFFVREPSATSSLLFTGAVSLFIGLSDVHVFFIAGALAFFLALFDKTLKRSRACLFIAVMAGAAFAFFSYVRYVGLHQAGADMVVSQGSGWSLSLYNALFLKDALKSLVYPQFAGPVSAYILPYVPIMGLVILLAPQKPRLAFRLLILLGLVAALFLFGVVCHGVEPLRAKLPSAMRYHLAIIPFLVNLWVVFHLNDLQQALFHFHLEKGYGFWVLFALAVFFREINMGFYNPKSDGFLAGFFFTREFSLLGVRSLIRHCLSVFPLLFAVGVLLNQRFSSKVYRQAFSLALFVLVPMTYLPILSYGFPVPSNVDFGIYRSLYRDLPQAIKESLTGERCVSVVPIAKGTVSQDRGRNDKLLPLIEYPELMGGRSFFHWRYSYSRNTSELYSRLTGQGPINFFPPVPGLLNETLRFSEASLSPILISADADIKDDRLLLIRQFRIGSRWLEKHPESQTGLTGDVYVYQVRNVSEFMQKTFAKIFYSRVSAIFHIKEGINGPIRLPITFFSELRAQDGKGENIVLKRGLDGFVLAEPTLAQREIKITSFSWVSIVSLFSPLACFGLLMFGRRLLIRLGDH